MLSIACLTTFTRSFTINGYPPLINEMSGALGMSLIEAGLLSSLTSVAQMSFTFVGGILSDRIGTKRAMGVGIAIMVAAQVMSPVVNTFRLEATARLCLGVGVGIAIVNVIKSVSERFPPRELAFTESLQASGWAAGNVMALAAAVPIGLTLGTSWK